MKKLLTVLTQHLLITAVALAESTTPETKNTETLSAFRVSATRTPAAPHTIGSAVEFLSPEEIARTQLASLRAALAGFSGAPTASAGGLGGNSSLFLRGANSNQTLFLVDGIRFNDPNTDYLVWLGGSRPCACDSIEISHGPQSTLYGGEAIGGVIALRSEPGSGPSRSNLAIEVGSFGTIQGAIHTQSGASSESHNWAYNFSAVGGSTQNERSNNDFRSANYALRLDRKVTDAVAIGATLRGFAGRYGSPGARVGFNANDPDNEERETNQLGTVFAQIDSNPELSTHITLGGQLRRYIAESPGPFGTSITEITNRRAVFDSQTSYTGFSDHRLTAGATLENSHTRNTGFGNIDKSQNLVAVFAQDEWNPLKKLFLSAGLRHDSFNTFGSATTGRATLAHLVANDRVKLRATYGTAFRTPSFLDLYGQSAFYVGNPNLNPERARAWDLGADFYLGEKIGSLGITFFRTQLTDLITFDSSVSPSTVRNIKRARSEGIELNGRFNLSKHTELKIVYTYLQADDLSGGVRLLRRPRHSGSANIWHDFKNGFTLGAGISFAAQREDGHASNFARIDAEDYTVTRLYLAWKASEQLTVKARVENALNESYEEIHGYPALPLGVFVGLDWKL